MAIKCDIVLLFYKWEKIEHMEYWSVHRTVLSHSVLHFIAYWSPSEKFVTFEYWYGITVLYHLTLLLIYLIIFNQNIDALLRCPICFDFLNISMMTQCSHNCKYVPQLLVTLVKCMSIWLWAFIQCSDVSSLKATGRWITELFCTHFHDMSFV